MTDIEIKRGYEVLPDNNVRFGVRVINNSDSAISDVEVILDYTESLFEIEGNKIQKLGNIPPTVPRTAKFILKPLGCVHKEEIGATVLYKDHQWKKHTLEMRPKEVHCVFPFLKEKSITKADFLRLSNSGYLEERGVNFEGINVDKLVSFLSHSCKNRLYKIDEFPIENGKILYLAGDALGEKAYYLLTAVVKEYEGLTQVLLRASSDKSYGLNGFLNETLDNLRHIVVSTSAREIGVIKKEQVINIIDSVVQRSTISMEEGEPSVKIKDSMVQRTEIKGDEERKRREQEREEQERLRREEERAQREKTRQEEERIAGEREELRARGEEKGTSYNKFLIVALVLGMLVLGYWALALSENNVPETTKSTPPESTQSEGETPPPPESTSSGDETPPPPESTPSGDETPPPPESTPTPPPTSTPLLKRLNVVTEVFNNNVDAATAAGLERTGRGQAFENGYYYVVERQGDKYVALNGKIDKLVKLVREDGKILSKDGTVYIEKKSLLVGETWDVGDGWTLTAQSIDAKASPRQVWLLLSKDGIKKDDKVVSEGAIYTYVEKSIGGEFDVPLFVTYVDSVFAGATSDMAQFTYTWVISP